MSGKIDSIKIRMYNTGSVGDCFLLLFQKNNVTTFSMMIDCGGIKTTSASVTPCVQDIKATCNGKLDLLVVTHQHEDHLSGFNLARPVFDQITADEVWMSWVEDKTDPVATILKKKYGKKLKELKNSTQSALTQLKKFSLGNSAVSGIKKSINARKQNMEDVLALLEFEEGSAHAPGLNAGKATNEDAMSYVKNKGKKMTYRLPGEVIKNVTGAEGMKFYVLGPPRDNDLKYLKIEMDEDEMYHLAVAGKVASFSSAADRILQTGTILQNYVSPFGDEFLLKGIPRKEFLRQYNSPDFKWRQIETDWLDSGSDVALALTKLTNNTSLALALEFEDSGTVILLPADAQSGNWISWHRPELMQSLKTKGGKDTNELLANTVFYKVGHHLSHNGTASVSGLEMMTNEKLVAFAPLIQDKVPVAWGGASNFPAKALYKKVIEKTKGRLVRTDMGLITDGNAPALRDQLSPNLKAELKNNFKKGSCYFEYTVKG